MNGTYPANPFVLLTPEQEEKKRLRRDANFIGFLLLALLAAQFVCSFAQYGMHLAGILALDKDDYGLGNTGYLLLNMIVYLVALLVPTLLVAAIARRRENPFPMRRVAAGNYVVAFFGGMALAVAANCVTSWLMTILVNLGVPYPSFPDSIEPTVTSLLLNVVSTAVMPALVEEMVFRGYLMGALRPYGDRMAIILSAALFGLIHGNILQMPFAFLLGLVLGWLVVQTGSLWPSVLLHFGNNLMSVLLSYGEKRLPQDETLVMAVFLPVAVIGAVTFLAAFVFRRPRGGDLLRPVGNGVSPLSVQRRVSGVLTAPALLVGMVLWVLILVLGMR